MAFDKLSKALTAARTEAESLVEQVSREAVNRVHEAITSLEAVLVHAQPAPDAKEIPAEPVATAPAPAVDPAPTATDAPGATVTAAAAPAAS